MNNWQTLGEKLDRKNYRAAIRKALIGQTKSIRIGRSGNVSGFSNSTPIEVIDGDASPQLTGQPYLSTSFRRGAFFRNLYTPSTLRVIVGRNWKATN
jgi:hypothetical protein